MGGLPPGEQSGGGSVRLWRTELFAYEEGDRPVTEKEKDIKEKLITLYGLQCWGCNDAITGSHQLVLDHHMPKVDGGSDTIANRILLCHTCNTDKGDGLTLSGLRAKNKAGKRAMPSTFDAKTAVERNRMHHENTLRGKPIQGELSSMETMIKEVEENPTPPVHPTLVVDNLIALLWRQRHKDLAAALQDVIRIEPLVAEFNPSVLVGCNVIFGNGDGAAKAIVAFESAICRGSTKIGEILDEGDQTLAFLEALGIATGFYVDAISCGVVYNKPIRVMFAGVDDLPF